MSSYTDSIDEFIQQNTVISTVFSRRLKWVERAARIDQLNLVLERTPELSDERRESMLEAIRRYEAEIEEIKEEIEQGREDFDDISEKLLYLPGADIE